jgi:copper transport protein
MGVAIAGLCAMLVGAAFGRHALAEGLLVVGAATALASFGLTGHAATAPPIWLTASALVVHTSCIAYWLGSLAPLYLRLGRLPAEDAAAVVKRFSAIAVGLVAVLLACGLILAAVQVRAPGALVDTDYGRRLLIKLGFVAGLLLLAAVNKSRLASRLAQPGSSAALWLRRSIIAEFALMAGVLLVTATLGQVVPPRETLALADADQGFSGMAMTGEAMADIAVTPARSGANRVVLNLTDANGAPLEAFEVTVWIENSALGIEPIAQKAAKQGEGEYTLPAALFPVAGTWKMTIEALVSDFEQTSFTAEVPIK